MIDFPSSPSVGQTFNSGSGAIYVWDGVAWSIATSQTATALSRNLIVNPGMAISQENGTTAGTINNYYPADQWSTRLNASGAAFSANVSYTQINLSGSPGRILYKTTTAKVSLAAGDYAGFVTILEGARAYPLAYATNTPVQSVLRFGFNGPAGTYSVAIRNISAYTVCWIGQFTIAAGQANTDTTQVLVIPAPPTGYAWGGGSAAQVELWFTFATTGSGFVAPANGWQAGQFIAGPGQFNLLGTVNNQAQIWDVGLYADPNRTGLPPVFQVPDYALDLFECQRYWEPVPAAQTMWVGDLNGYSNDRRMVPKRISPSLAITNMAQVGNAASYPKVTAWQLSAFQLTLAASGANTLIQATMIVNANARM